MAIAAPTNLVVTRISDTQTKFVWTDPKVQVSLYPPTFKSIYDNTYVSMWSSTIGDWYGETKLSGGAEAFTFGTNPNHRYRFRVRGNVGSTYSDYVGSNYIQTTPSAPSSCSASLSGGTVTVKWKNNAATANGYVYTTGVEECVNGGSWSQFTTVAAGTTSVTRNVAPGSTYTYRVRAISTVGANAYSGYSTSASVSPGEPSKISTTWYDDGDFTAYDASIPGLSDSALLLLADGVVDTDAATRIQYEGYVRSTAYFEFHAIDSYGTSGIINPGTAYMSAQLFIAPDSAVGSPNPSVADVINGAISSGLISNARAYWAVWKTDASGTVTPIVPSSSTQREACEFDRITYPSFSPGTKYWAVVAPVVISQADYQIGLNSPGSAPAGNPLIGDTTWPGSRAISFWTNRTPSAPTITSPQSNVVVNAGDTIALTCSFNDPDAVMGGFTPAFTDVAGVQVQYSAAPGPDNPSPSWLDLPFASPDASTMEPGWFLVGSDHSDPNGGPAQLVNTGSVDIDCGAQTATALHALLPSGTWRIRVRAFDFGTPDSTRAFAESTGDFTIADAPTYNTSAWSSTVYIVISAQVPPPDPLFPIRAAALPQGSNVVLSWIYKNTHLPPYDQASRTIQIRKVGDTDWTALATDDASADTTFAVDSSSFALVSGNEYEWRVQVTDTDGAESNWSQSATFWIVPAPASGPVLPSRPTTLDGATLGCGTHRVFVFRRGAQTRVGEITQMSHVDWGRLRDDISSASIVVSGWDVDCGNLLGQLQTWAYEVVVFRDNGFTVDRVWEGPITGLTYEVDKVTIDAKDVMVYAYRRDIKQDMIDTGDGDTVVSRSARILQNVFAPDDPNLLAYLTVVAKSDDAMEYRSLPAYSRTAYEEIDDMAANAGLDYCAVGRRIILWGTKHRIGLLPEFRDADLGSPPIVSEYGMSFANHYAISDGNGIYGDATRGGVVVNGSEVSAVDPVYGLVELLSSSWASDSEEDTDTYTQAGIEKMQQSFDESSELSIDSRYPPPVVVRVPDNTTLNPDTVVSIQQLIPGVAIPLRSTGTLRAVSTTQKLDSIAVTEEDGKETITIVMSAFNSDDADMGDDGGDE